MQVDLISIQKNGMSSIIGEDIWIGLPFLWTNPNQIANSPVFADSSNYSYNYTTTTPLLAS